MSFLGRSARALGLTLLFAGNLIGCGTRALKAPGGADGGGLDATGGDSAGSVGGTTNSGGSSAGEGGATSAGGEAGGSSGSGGSVGGAGGATGGAGGTGHDACVTDADCPPVRCVAAPCPDTLCTLGDGFHVCVQRAHPTPLSCQNNPNPSVPTGQPCCSSDAECTAKPHGMCVPLTFDYCGGPAIAMANSCLYDECQADADCAALPHGVCVNGYPRRCEDGPCRTNADCNQGPGGTCVQEAVGVFCASLEVFCRYANDPCVQNSDCKAPPSGFSNVACVPNDNRHGTVCRDLGPPPL